MLFKNVRRTLLKKWMQLTAIGIIIILSSMTYTMMFYGLSGIEEPTKDYLRDYNQEDFSVEILNMVTEEESAAPEVMSLLKQGLYSLSDIKNADSRFFYSLMKKRIAAFENIYSGYAAELRELKTINFDFLPTPNNPAENSAAKAASHKALLVKDANQINQSYIEEGRKPAADDEIAINKIYAVKNSLKLGDSLALGTKSYEITGFVLMPDYTLPMFDNTFNIDPGLQTLVLMTDREYELYPAKESFRFSGVNLGEDDIDISFDRAALPFVVQITTTATSMRSGAIYDELEQGKVMALGLSIFIVSIAIIIVSILIYNLLNAERSKIGILKALGYRRREISRPYSLSILIFAFFMLVIGYIAGLFYAEPLKQLYLDFYLLPSIKIEQKPVVFITAVFAPLAFLGAMSSLVNNIILRENALKLLQPRRDKSISILGRLIGRLLIKAKGSTKFKYLYVLRNPGSFFLFFIGILFSTILLNFSFMANGMLERMTTEYLDMVDYEYEAYADLTKGLPKTAEGEEQFLNYPYGYLDENLVTLQGLSQSSTLYRLYDSSGKDMTSLLGSGAVISKKLSMKLSIETGDKIKVKLNKNYFEFEVKGISAEYISDTVYLDIQTLSSLLTLDKRPDFFNGIYAKTKPSSKIYSIIISKESILEQAKAMENYMQFITTVLMSGAAIISISILFVLTSLTVESNYYVISLLKVMGYRRKEVNSMILSSYFVYSLISYLISIPISVAVLDLLMDIFATEYGVVLPLEFKPIHIAIGLLLLMLIFFAGTFVSRRKIQKIELQEALKTYGE